MQLEGVESDLDCQDVERLSFLSAMSTDYLSMDSRLISDLDDTADEGGAYTDNEPDVETMHISAISRSSEPVTAEEILRRYSPDIRSRMRKISSSHEVLNRSSPPSVFLLDSKVKLSLKDDSVLLSGSINPHHHHRQHHPPTPSSSQSYDSPSSSSPASSNNEPRIPTSHSAVSSGRLPPPPTHHFNSCGKFEPPRAPKPISCGSTAEASVHSPVALPSATMAACRQLEVAAEDSPAEDPSMKSFLGKIKAFEKMDHFARVRRMLEVQEAQNARLEIAQKHPDIYAVPLKTAKLDHNRLQPICSSSHPEPQAPPYSQEGRPFYPSKEDTEKEAAPGYYTTNSYQYQDTEL